MLFESFRFTELTELFGSLLAEFWVASGRSLPTRLLRGMYKTRHYFVSGAFRWIQGPSLSIRLVSDMFKTCAMGSIRANSEEGVYNRLGVGGMSTGGGVADLLLTGPFFNIFFLTDN